MRWVNELAPAECERLKLQPPTLFATPAPAIVTGENTTEMMDYLDIMSVRRRSFAGHFAYHKPALQTALFALLKKSFHKVQVSDPMTRDARAAVLSPDPIRRFRWMAEVAMFEPVKDLRVPSDTLFVDSAHHQPE